MSLRLVGKRLRQPTRSRNVRARVKPALVLTGMLASLLVSATTQAQGISGFIPSNRAVDWSHAGIPGGIPSANWPIYQTLLPSGGSDDSVAIQSAINAAPAGSVIVLKPGTYKIN